jgi:coproporphyrinogen III oxidase|eukprot:CAMPEP_0202963888 /NCGR_PEP_ID=MMETSP1396-20130829/7936_1 /ASSEMBLY_ACC=CAM_ASM_000872 /TAXON_ID= /ORGANISM="Pseudokeronopsis sp., Strain Brazil" /LENGTH=365 /DNA_ID=CAMNT_0049685525 /DNA_START=49 /DNA_END=1146 /DNA_ORIENTATION=+
MKFCISISLAVLGDYLVGTHAFTGPSALSRTSFLSMVFNSVDSEKTIDNVGLASMVDPDFKGGDKELLIKMERMLREAQLSICKAIEDIDGGAKFQEDAWVRDTGGGGMSRVLGNGNVWEKAGVNLSVVHGTMPQEALRAATERGVNRGQDAVPFSACGLSCVMHPRNPHCPTMHFNYRLFQTAGGNWWFGGGTDITPSYLVEEDMKHFHGVYKDVCDRHDPEYYPKFKKWADEYFLIKHRGERRGLGGIFFDDLNDRDPNEIFEFCKDSVNHVVAAYGPIIEKHKNDSFTEEEKRWQQLRRGRYAEFNLVYDRGTIFGLKTNGRTESILMSLPETARWEYDHHPEEGSPEAEFLDACMNPRDWV